MTRSGRAGGVDAPTPRRADPGPGARLPGARAVGAVATLLLLAAACGGREVGGGPVPDSVYVEAMARLVLLDTAVSPTLEPPVSGAALDSARDRVLERWGVDTGELLAFARNRGDDPDRMRAIWQRVYELSGTLKEQAWRPLPDSLDPLAGDTLPGAAADTASDTAEEPADTAREAGLGEGGR